VSLPYTPLSPSSPWSHIYANRREISSVPPQTRGFLLAWDDLCYLRATTTAAATIKAIRQLKGLFKIEIY
jgi:hypothetical protein